MSGTPPYLFYLFLGEAIFVQITYSIVIYKNCKMLFWIFADLYKRQIFISPILVLHSGLWIIIASTTLLHNTYTLALWRPNTIIYDPKYFYISAMIYFCFMPAAAVSLLFSTIERCFVFIIYNRTKLQKIQRLIFVANVFVVFLVIGFMIEAVFVSTPNPFPNQTPSLTPGTMSDNNLPEMRRNLFRLINSGLNFFAVAILTILLRKTKALTVLNNQRDMALLVQKIILIHTILDLFIQVLAHSVLLITGDSASNIFGSYSRTLLAFDGLLCSMIFVKSIEKIRSRTLKPNNSSSNNRTKMAATKKPTPEIA